MWMWQPFTTQSLVTFEAWHISPKLHGPTHLVLRYARSPALILRAKPSLFLARAGSRYQPAARSGRPTKTCMRRRTSLGPAASLLRARIVTIWERAMAAKKRDDEEKASRSYRILHVEIMFYH